MNFTYLKFKLAKAQFAILLLGFILQRSPAVQIVALFEKALKVPSAQIIRSATWLATGMGLFHATAGATGLQSSVDGASFTNRTAFTIDVGEETTLSLNLEGVQVAYWEIDAASDFVDGFDFISDQIPPGLLEGPFQRTGGPGGVNDYYRINSQLLTLSGAPTTPSQIATLEPDGFFSNQNVLGIKAYDANGESEGGWYEIAVEVPLTVPVILYDPVSIRVPTGGRAQFFFEVEGGVDTIQWLKDGVEIPEATAETLVIQEVAEADEGDYSVEVTNSSGSVVSAAATLTIDNTATSELVNLSNRGFVGVGGDVMIPGMTVIGGASKTVLVRGLGPALEASGVPGFLVDPELKVFQAIFDQNGAFVGSQLLLTNDDWELGPDADELASVLADRNLELAPGSKDAAILVTLNQGVYTFQLFGVGNTTGVGLVELFVID